MGLTSNYHFGEEKKFFIKIILLLVFHFQAICSWAKTPFYFQNLTASFNLWKPTH